MKYFYLFSLSFLYISVLAQKHYGCASMEALATQEQVALEKMNERLYKDLSQPTSPKNDSIIRLPVVVHIVHREGVENISDEQVYRGIQHLNDAFANQNRYDRGEGVDTRICFCLAKIAPDGGYTNGITRTKSDLSNLTFLRDDFKLKRLIRWNTRDYINIWLVREITNLPCTPNVTGYARFPSSHGTSTDGIVCEARFFGSNTANSVVQVHEMGHYLGLLHTFEGQDCKNFVCLRDGDRVCDTPPDRLNTTSGRACDDPHNSCNTDTYDGFEEDQRDMISNYMDYEDTSCQHNFTQGQSERMRTAITRFRSSLLVSDVCDLICEEPITALFEYDQERITIHEEVVFDAIDNNAATYEWRLEEELVSNDPNFRYQFSQTGQYQLELTVTHPNWGTSCRSTYEEQIEVFCTAEADFIVDTLNILPGDTLNFENISRAASDFTWVLDGEKIAETDDVKWIFEEAGTYQLGLQANTDECTDERTVIVQVGTVIPDVNLKFEKESFRCGRDSVYFIFEVCNVGNAPMAAGVPIRFYDGSPFRTEASLLSTFTTPSEIPNNCCETFEYTTLASAAGHFYAVINDENGTLPIAFNSPDFQVKYYETNLVNNEASFNTFQLKPLDYAYLDTTVCYNGDTFQLRTEVPDAYYLWDNGDTLPYTTFYTSETHWVDLTYCGFTRRHRYEINLRNCSCKWEMPNVFTPNGDGTNDEFGLAYDCEYGITDFYMRIFNRWGNVVFESNDVEMAWEGDGLPSDIYYYEVLFKESYEGKQESHQRKGKVSLLR
ncbi:MAG: M43 family zinc metalloprotease [Bacteroidota bacterium]